MALLVITILEWPLMLIGMGITFYLVSSSQFNAPKTVVPELQLVLFMAFISFFFMYKIFGN